MREVEVDVDDVLVEEAVVVLKGAVKVMSCAATFGDRWKVTAMRK